MPPHLRQRGGSRDDDGYDDAPLPTRTSYGMESENFLLPLQIMEAVKLCRVSDMIHGQI